MRSPRGTVRRDTGKRVQASAPAFKGYAKEGELIVDPEGVDQRETRWLFAGKSRGSR